MTSTLPPAETAPCPIRSASLRGVATERATRGQKGGIDLDDLGDDHSLTGDPTLVRLRAAAATLGEDAWIAVRLPGTYEGEDEIDDDAAINRWSTVVTHPRRTWAGWARPCTHRDEAEDHDDGRERR